MSVDALLAPIRAHIAGLGFELVDLRHVGTVERPILQVRVDRPDSRPGQGITAEDCVGISRSLERFLESSAMVGPRYVLEVSYPGIERPLVAFDQGHRMAGIEKTDRDARAHQPGAHHPNAAHGPRLRVLETGDARRVALCEEQIPQCCCFLALPQPLEHRALLDEALLER